MFNLHWMHHVRGGLLKFDRFSRDLRTELAFGPALFGLHRPVLECMRP